MIEASASWLFVFLVLIYTAMSGPKSGAIVGVAMALMTFLLGGLQLGFIVGLL